MKDQIIKDLKKTLEISKDDKLRMKDEHVRAMSIVTEEKIKIESSSKEEQKRLSGKDLESQQERSQLENRLMASERQREEFIAELPNSNPNPNWRQREEFIAKLERAKREKEKLIEHVEESRN